MAFDHRRQAGISLQPPCLSRKNRSRPRPQFRTARRKENAVPRFEHEAVFELPADRPRRRDHARGNGHNWNCRWRNVGHRSRFGGPAVQDGFRNQFGKVPTDAAAPPPPTGAADRARRRVRTAAAPRQSARLVIQPLQRRTKRPLIAGLRPVPAERAGLVVS